MFRNCVLALSCVGITAIASADTLHVPDEFASIQTAIDAAVEGDTVLIASGTYFEQLDTLGKAITITSENGHTETYVDGLFFDGAILTVASGETAGTIIDGLTIRNGDGFNGGGIFITESSPTISNCRITSNTVTYSGAGVYIDGGSPSIVDTSIDGNDAGGAGGGLYAKFATLTLTGVTISNNLGNNGAGLYVKDGPDEWAMTNVTVEDNSANLDGGGMYLKGTSATLEDCVFDGNDAGYRGGAWFSYSGGDATVTNSLLRGNISVDSGGALEVRSSSIEFVDCDFQENIADSDCDGQGSGAVANTVNGTVTLEDCSSCDNLACDAEGDFSGEEPVIVGTLDGCEETLGACCAGEACFEMAEEDCTAAGGTFQGIGVLCIDVECEDGGGGGISAACCLGGVCIEAEEAACGDAGGFYMGDEVHCIVGLCFPVTGGCCVGGSCVETDLVSCLSAGGTYSGDGVTCDVTECSTLCAADINGDGEVGVGDLVELIAGWGACP